ncbi:MAG: putative DNA repair protein MutK [Paracoccaceae bacterium]|jgi:predicted DNA repair protein MutK
MSGLLALLDDVAGIAKIAAASVDDVAAQALKAGAKAAGAVIDDAAVTPKYVTGFAAERELPIIWRIAKGSFRNKLLYLLPVGLLLANFAPWLISPLLMLGGCYLCFEGAEKIAHLFLPHKVEKKAEMTGNLAHLEEQKASGAIKTDFILSAEIMTIALAAIPESNIWMEAATLALVGIGITVTVYGSVALIVKADDVGLYAAQNGYFSVTRNIGRAVVRGMPKFLALLLIIGTAAMLWVGGSIVLHGMGELGFGWLGHHIHYWAAMVAHLVPVSVRAATEWSITAALDGVFGVALGLVLIPVVVYGIAPVWQKVSRRG